MKTEYKGYTIETWNDNEAESPREWDNVSVMLFAHRRYDLGDKWPVSEGSFHSWDELRRWIIKTYKPVMIQPVRMYDHSGQTISLPQASNGEGQGVWRYPYNDQWDSGMIGYVFVPRAKALEELGGKRTTEQVRKWVRDTIKGEVETYDLYMRGEVYGYTVTDQSGEVVDSCGGFIGEHDAVLTEAKGAVDADIQYNKSHPQGQMELPGMGLD